MFDTEKHPCFTDQSKYSRKRSNQTCRHKIEKDKSNVLDAQFGKRRDPKSKRNTVRWNAELTQCSSKELGGPNYEQDFGIYLQAFALIYVLPEEEWLSENIDKLLTDGKDLFRASSEEDHDDGIKYETGSSIRRNFELEGHNFTLELKPPCKKQQLQHIVKNLKPVLKEFFDSAYYCLFQHKTLNLLIWQRDIHFFVMNVMGRQPVDMHGYKTDCTLLVRLPSLNNVIQMIRNLSCCKRCDEFTIRELSVIRLVTPDGRCFLRNSTQPSMEYSVINKNYAFLKSNLHLSLDPAELLRNGSSLVVGIIGILAANIEHPASWMTKTLDSIMCFGVELYSNRWCANSQEYLPIDLKTFPTRVRLGQFMVEIQLLPEKCSGQWRGSNAYKDKNFALEISKILKVYGNALFQINSQFYALWCKDGFYYILDPYRHQVLTSSQTQEHNNDTICSKWATVRMFRDLANMLNVFHQLLKESNVHSPFNIHALAIKHISESSQEDAKCASIRFPQLLNNYEQLLAGDSDYKLDVVNDLKDPIDVESFTLIHSKCKENDFHRIDVEVEVLRPSKAKHDIHNQRSQTDVQVLPTTKPLRQAKDYKNNNKTKEKLRTKRVSDVSSARKTEAAANRKKANELRLSKRSARKDLTDVMKPKIDMKTLSQIDAKMSAKYRSIDIKHLRLDDCLECQRCPAGQNLSTQMLKNVSKISLHTTQSMDLLSPEKRFPIYSKNPANLAVAGSESGTMESLNRLLDVAFKVSNRVFTMTPWGNYVVFRNRKSTDNNLFYIFDGCTCNIDRFRHLDLRKGTAGMLPFQSQSQVVCFMIDARESKALTLVRSRLEQPARCT